MKRLWLAIAVLTLVVLLAGSSRAQVTFAAGPRIGFNLGFAVLDHSRAGRTGMPEVVFCQGKTPEQVVAIIGRLLTIEGRALATRAAVETAAAVLAAYPQAQWSQLARVISLR